MTGLVQADPQTVTPVTHTPIHNPSDTLPTHNKVQLGVTTTPGHQQQEQRQEEEEEEVKTALGLMPGSVGLSLGIGGGMGLPPTGPFPPPHHHNHQHPPQRPGVGVDVFPGVSPPQCARTFTYCPHHLEYPREAVNSIIDRFYNDVTIIYNDLYQIPSHDVFYHDNRTRFFKRPDGHFVCESDVDYVRPGWAQNVRGEWVAILNTDKFPQTIRVEVCRYGGKRCEYLPPCYKSSCVQRFSYVRLLSLSPYHPSHRPVVDVFQIPSACSCFVEDFVYF
ncbi:hypothetical protein Pmani_011762 [Petrolisthes manimaculis]|uniref:Spaetzle domain-containing protein n=1 Tax=Petrolisthes manimaculis TaxID=1843537 RepID=A0AAE1PZC9_9EUCA|nr:hypothetical protein Pmani_011762 [Petrolisthes manimaculis]